MPYHKTNFIKVIKSGRENWFNDSAATCPPGKVLQPAKHTLWMIRTETAASSVFMAEGVFCLGKRKGGNEMEYFIEKDGKVIKSSEEGLEKQNGIPYAEIVYTTDQI